MRAVLRSLFVLQADGNAAILRWDPFYPQPYSQVWYGLVQVAECVGSKGEPWRYCRICWMFLLHAMVSGAKCTILWSPAGLVPVLFLLRFVTLWRAHPALGSFRSDKKCVSNCTFMVELEWKARNQDDDVAKSYILHSTDFQWNVWNPNPTSRCIKFFACFDLFVLLLNYVKSC